MNARDLHDATIDLLEKGVDRLFYGTDERQIVLRALDLLARVEESEDELVRELRGQHCRDFGSDPQCDADGLCICAMHERAAAALVAERAAKEKAEADLVARERTWNTAMNASDRTTSEWRRACKQAEAERDSLKRHAEAMAETLDKWAHIDECKCPVVDAYRTAQEKQAMNLPELNDGELLAGLCMVDCKPSHWLILLPATTDKDLTWQEAIDWAKSVGGELPSRFESALLYANLRDKVDPDYWYWTATAHEREPSWAWGQYFYDGYQNYYRKDLRFRARAVRRVPFTEKP